MTDDTCTATKNDGEPCTYTAKYDDGKCGIHTDESGTSPGRPTKLSYDRQERIATALESGVSFKAACEAAGINADTGHRWMRRGEEQDEGEFSDFYDRVTRARGMGKFDLSQSIVEIAKERQDARTLLKYLQYIEGGEASQEDDVAGLNLVVPEEAVREDT